MQVFLLSSICRTWRSSRFSRSQSKVKTSGNPVFRGRTKIPHPKSRDFFFFFWERTLCNEMNNLNNYSCAAWLTGWHNAICFIYFKWNYNQSHSPKQVYCLSSTIHWIWISGHVLVIGSIIQGCLVKVV